MSANDLLEDSLPQPALVAGQSPCNAFMCRQGWRSLASSEDSQHALLELWPQLKLLLKWVRVIFEARQTFNSFPSGALHVRRACRKTRCHRGKRSSIKVHRASCFSTSCHRQRPDAQPPDSVSPIFCRAYEMALYDSDSGLQHTPPSGARPAINHGPSR